MPTVLSTLAHTFSRGLASPIDGKALVAALAVFTVTKYLVRRCTAAVPDGPLLYKLTQADTKVPFMLRQLFGDYVAMQAMEGGTAHVEWQALAVQKRNDPRAAALMWSGPTYSIILTHPDDVRHVTLERPDLFAKAEFFKMLEVLTGKNGLISIVDEQAHSEQFGLVSHAFASKHVRSVVNTTVRAEFDELLQRLLQLAPAGSEGTACVSLEKETGTATLRGTAKAALGVSDLSQLDNLTEFLHQPLSPLLMLGADNYNRLPIHRNRLARESREDLCAPVLTAFSDARLRLHREAQEDEGAGESSEEEPLVDEAARGASSVWPRGAHKLLVEVLAENPRITEKEVVDHSATFVFAGYETTACAWNWALYLLTHNREAQRVLFEELRAAVPAGQVPTVESVLGLPYLTAVVRELLRHSPPVTGILRTTTQDTVLPGSGTYLPKGTDVNVSIYGLHHRKDVYGDDAGAFRPERWLDDPELFERVNGSWYLPFLAGKRACVGREMAYAELHIGIAMMVRNFDLLWPDGQPLPQRKITIAMHPSIPCLNLLRRRED